jgi:phosphatidylserine/phosphatidylglycerophosphate/cardiolipin synthase-like enzyme
VPDAALGFTPVSRLFVEPRDGDAFLQVALDGAQSSVDVVMYILTDDGTENRLVAAHRRGVAVRVMLDPDQSANASARSRLQNAGVPVRDGPTSFTHVHQKTVVVDHAEAFIMTLNASYSGFRENREYVAAVTRAAEIADLDSLFEADWNRQTAPALASPLVVSPANARVRLRQFLGQATTDVLLTLETFTDDNIRALLRSRLDAGVAIRVLLADPSAVDQNTASAATLRNQGFQVRFLRVPMLHAKLIVVDGRLAYLGSINLTRTSVDQNREVGILVDDPSVVANLSAQAEADWAAGTTP